MEMETVTIRLDKDLLDIIDSEVEKYRGSRSVVIRQLLLYQYGLIDATMYGKKSTKKNK